MSLAHRVRIAAMASALVMTICALPATAQEVSDSHLAIARKAVDAINATDQFDAVLPQAARTLKGELTQKNPDLVALINATVDEKALELAGRRADLEREAALVYARVFSEEELTAIHQFYTSPAGEKLLADGPIVTREVLRAGEIWQRGIARDLAQMVGAQIRTVVEAKGEGEVAPKAEEGSAQ